MFRKKTLKFIFMREKGIAIKSGFRQPLESWSLFFCLLISSAWIISYHNSILLKQQKMGKFISGLLTFHPLQLRCIIFTNGKKMYSISTSGPKHAIIPQHPQHIWWSRKEEWHVRISCCTIIFHYRESVLPNAQIKLYTWDQKVLKKWGEITL